MAAASLRICFLIIGATPAGLASAVSLRQAGHHVVLLEVDDPRADAYDIMSVPVPPNMSKLLLRWGLEEELKSTSVQCRSMFIQHYERGDALGEHIWYEELFKDAGGDFLNMSYSDILRILRQKAVSLGTEIIQDARISSIDFDDNERPSVRLASGDVVEADVVVGTEGLGSVARTAIVGEEIQGTSMGLITFNLTVPQEAMAADPLLAPLLEQRKVLHSWWGDSRGAVAWVAGVHPQYFLRVHVPEELEEELIWRRDITPEQVMAHMGKCEPRLRRLVALSTAVWCTPLTEPAQLETWTHQSGRMLIIGDAAHPFPIGAFNEVANLVCDAAVLGELFRHLHSEDQIASFLQAFESLRREHAKATLDADVANYGLFAMPPGEEHEMRDRFMQEKYRAGIEAFTGTEDDRLAAAWEKDKDFLAYDAEDHAAEWWNDWGLLQERANRRAQVFAIEQIAQATQSVEVN